MPTIQNYTANQGPGTMPASTVNPNSFGAQAFQAIGNLGQQFSEIGAKAQHAQDQLDLVGLTSAYELQLDQEKNKIAQHPDVERHGEMLADASETLQDKLLKANPFVSGSVATAFQNHATGLYTSAALNLAHQGAQIKVQRALTDFSRTQENLTQKAASAPTLDGADQHLSLLDALRSNMVRQGVLSPQDGEKSHEAAQDRYWSLVAQQDPNRLMGMLADRKEGAGFVAGMDNQKFTHYVNIAVNTLHQQQVQADQADKDAEKLIKRTQEVTAASATADVLQGKPVNVADLVRTRALDDAVGRTLAEIQAKGARQQDPSKYQRGLATTTETALVKAKYDSKPLGSAMMASIADDYTRDRITKDEYSHLMSVYSSVNDYKQQQGKETGNQAVTHAHANLQHELRTSGPADKYDALSEQTMVNADQFYWRKMQQNPNADPWAVAKEASGIFKPVIEKRLALSKDDKAKLDDARITGLVQTKSISTAAAKALRDETQDTEGKRIVQEALKNLPLPPEPGWWDRFQGLLPSTSQKAPAAIKPRKPAGVMGE